ncbi:hypothetical protein AcW1_007650 [Taiwanofungus camphoratus]|nr:hypothetical protein AcV5_007631 [Antrodia cinnamomea]KAI0953427.1 hypothetical protein AcW1_007650 [Antrodia cinnamomea]
MCVAFWSLEHPRYALILCSNRDEYLSRPTAKAHFHSFGSINNGTSDESSVLSGRDLLAGGTWVGVSRTGRVTLLTNITEPPGKYETSRGSLTSTFLLPKSPGRTLQYEVADIVAQNAKFAGFNLLLLSPSRLTDMDGTRNLSLDAAFLTNFGGGGAITARNLSNEERRCGGMSNGIDRQGASDWPKVKRGIQALDHVLNSMSEDINETKFVEDLFQLLTWTSDPAPIDRSALRNTIQVEPILVPKVQSGDHIAHVYYGTRLSTVILIRRDGSVMFVERDIWALNPEGELTKADAKEERVFQFQIEPNVS